MNWKSRKTIHQENAPASESKEHLMIQSSKSKLTNMHNWFLFAEKFAATLKTKICENSQRIQWEIW